MGTANVNPLASQPPPEAKPLLAQQIYEIMRGAGFSQKAAITMTAIARRESAGIPTAFNGDTTTGDRSYGLLQINMRDPNVAALVYRDVLNIVPISDTSQREAALFDPATNAKAAFLLSNGGKIALINLLWYINRPGPYQDRYNLHLPEAQAAALLSAI